MQSKYVGGRQSVLCQWLVLHESVLRKQNIVEFDPTWLVHSSLFVPQASIDGPPPLFPARTRRKEKRDMCVLMGASRSLPALDFTTRIFRASSSQAIELASNVGQRGEALAALLRPSAGPGLHRPPDVRQDLGTTAVFWRRWAKRFGRRRVESTSESSGPREGSAERCPSFWLCSRNLPRSLLGLDVEQEVLPGRVRSTTLDKPQCHPTPNSERYLDHRVPATEERGRKHSLVRRASV
jgi:hypothetical protein